MQLKDREISILTSISNLRFLTTQQIHSLHGYNGKYGENVTRRKLKDLEDAGYLKSWQPDKYSSKIYYLTKVGSKEVELYNGYENVRTYQKSNHTLHQILVSEVYIHLKKIGRIRRFIIHQKVGEIETDAFVELQLDKAIKLMFIEADRATETLSVITEKLEEYKKVYDSKEWQSKYGIFPEVLFVTTTDARKRSLLRVLAKYPYRSKVLMDTDLKSDLRGIIG